MTDGGSKLFPSKLLEIASHIVVMNKKNVHSKNAAPQAGFFDSI